MKSLPLSAWLLGYAGILPFLLLYLILLFNPAMLDIYISHIGLWLLAYAAVILSFLGAVHWGVALSKIDHLSPLTINLLFGYSVLPSILAWLALLLPVKIAFYVMASLILLAYVVDKLLLFELLNSQYQRLRLHLTIAVSVLLVATGFAVG